MHVTFDATLYKCTCCKESIHLLIIVITNGLLINNCRIKGDGKKGGSKAEKGK
jgi:hypothetical protein